MTKKLSIVVPVFNKWNFTKACLDDLLRLSDEHEIIVVNNNSSDETTEKLLEFTSIKVINNEENFGFAKACNIGYAQSSSNNVLFLNNDIRVKSNHSDWTNVLIEKCNEGLVGPTMGQLDNELNFKQEANKLLDGKSYMSGWCLASSKDIFNQLIINGYKGPFSEEFGLAYFEDTDLGFRAREAKIKNVLVDIPVVHFGKQTSRQLNTYELYNKARQIFIKKWKK